MELMEYNNLSEEAKKKHKTPPSSINMNQKVGLKFWHKPEMTNWEQNLDIPKSAKGFHK